MVLTNTLVNSGIKAPATVPQLMIIDSTHQRAGCTTPAASLKSPRSTLLAMKVIAMGVHVLDVLVRPVEEIPEGQGGQLVADPLAEGPGRELGGFNRWKQHRVVGRSLVAR